MFLFFEMNADSSTMAKIKTSKARLMTTGKSMLGKELSLLIEICSDKLLPNNTLIN